ncbi:MAG: hypothetical protein ACTSUD_04510 [Alphaproteobacteria bacterium]
MRGPIRLLAIAGLAIAGLGAGLLPGPIGDAEAAGIEVYVARPVFAARRGDAVIRRRDALREAIAAAFDTSCRPAVTFDADLDKLSEVARSRLAGGNALGLAGRKSGEAPAPRGIVAAAVSRHGRGYRIRLAAFNLKTGKLHGTAEARAPLPGIERAAAKAARELRSHFPCPRWRGEIIVSSREVSAVKRPGLTRKGRIEWTTLIEVGARRARLTGRYEIEIESRRCPLPKPETGCVLRRLKGTGVARAGPGAGGSAKITVTGDGSYRITAGDAVARTSLRSVTCKPERDKKNCRAQTLVSDQFLAGAAAEGRARIAAGILAGAAIIAETGALKKTMSWRLRAEFD